MALIIPAESHTRPAHDRLPSLAGRSRVHARDARRDAGVIEHNLEVRDARRGQRQAQRLGGRAALERVQALLFDPAADDRAAAEQRAAVVLISDAGPAGLSLAAMVSRVGVDPEALAIGQKLFLNNCAQCHASDGGGSRGFPNLTDRDWLWGGTPEAINAAEAAILASAA